MQAEAEAGKNPAQDNGLAMREPDTPRIRKRQAGVALSSLPGGRPVSYTHLTLPTMCQV